MFNIITDSKMSSSEVDDELDNIYTNFAHHLKRGVYHSDISLIPLYIYACLATELKISIFVVNYFASTLYSAAKDLIFDGPSAFSVSLQCNSSDMYRMIAIITTFPFIVTIALLFDSSVLETYKSDETQESHEQNITHDDDTSL